MWLKLGEEELVNLDYCVAIRKEGLHSIELSYQDASSNRIIDLSDEQSRNIAFDRVVKNLVRLQQAME